MQTRDPKQPGPPAQIPDQQRTMSCCAASGMTIQSLERDPSRKRRQPRSWRSIKKAHTSDRAGAARPTPDLIRGRNKREQNNRERIVFFVSSRNDRREYPGPSAKKNRIFWVPDQVRDDNSGHPYKLELTAPHKRPRRRSRVEPQARHKGEQNTYVPEKSRTPSSGEKPFAPLGRRVWDEGNAKRLSFKYLHLPPPCPSPSRRGGPKRRYPAFCLPSGMDPKSSLGSAEKSMSNLQGVIESAFHATKMHQKEPREATV